MLLLLLILLIIVTVIVIIVIIIIVIIIIIIIIIIVIIIIVIVVITAASIYLLVAIFVACLVQSSMSRTSFWVLLDWKISASQTMLHSLEVPKFWFYIICLFISLLLVCLFIY